MSQPPVVVDLGSDVFSIDTEMSGYPGITAGYLIRTARPCLVETGAATSAARVGAALESCGLGPDDLATIVVTHIHLDHAGGVGDLARAFPRAEVVVHERGARHLVDPTRLLASAERVFGPVLDQVFGRLLPTEATRIRAVGMEGAIDLGAGRTLRSYYSPGHAQHHIGLLDDVTGDLYVGDAAGVYIPDVDLVRPATPPPDFDLDIALESLRTFDALRPTRLLFSHFGPASDVSLILERSAAELHRWVEAVRDARAESSDLDHAVAMVRERTRNATEQNYAGLYDSPELATKFEHLSSTRANVTGIAHWLERQDARPSPAA